MLTTTVVEPKMINNFFLVKKLEKNRKTDYNK